MERPRKEKIKLRVNKRIEFRDKIRLVFFI
jgi:hypothetical protein